MLLQYLCLLGSLGCISPPLVFVDRGSFSVFYVVLALPIRKSKLASYYKNVYKTVEGKALATRQDEQVKYTTLRPIAGSSFSNPRSWVVNNQVCWNYRPFVFAENSAGIVGVTLLHVWSDAAQTDASAGSPTACGWPGSLFPARTTRHWMIARQAVTSGFFARVKRCAIAGDR